MAVVLSFMLTISMACTLTISMACGQSFEVASVKLTTVPRQGFAITCLPGGERLRVTNIAPLWLIGAAYNVPVRQISGLPEEVAKDNYDIEAKAEHPVTRQQMMVMLRKLLEDRFKMVVRRETKEMKAQVLVAAKGGPKLDENQDGAEMFMDGIDRDKNKYGFRNVPMSTFVSGLANWVDDVVVDATGLAGTYDFTVQFTLARTGKETRGDPNGPSIYAALQEQLGLKLESRKVPVEMLVIDNIEKPAGNE
jgi:uncharacterized protein (TIGR03435 family)